MFLTTSIFNGKQGTSGYFVFSGLIWICHKVAAFSPQLFLWVHQNVASVGEDRHFQPLGGRTTWGGLEVLVVKKEIEYLEKTISLLSVNEK